MTWRVLMQRVSELSYKELLYNDLESARNKGEHFVGFETNANHVKIYSPNGKLHSEWRKDEGWKLYG